MFMPIAIVGRACVLPGALTPEDLWANIANGRDLIGAPPEGHWGLNPNDILARKEPPSETACSEMGGYVSGFDDVFDGQGFAVPAERIAPLDPMVKWLFHCGREALRDAGVNVLGRARPRSGVILGNLSYPTQGHEEFAQAVWLRDTLGSGDPKVPENRFNSGYPGHLLADALGLGGDAFMLDAACASSLYAIKLACDRLQDGKADLMLAGAVNRADDLFLHIGFTALQALSPSGRSRPFDAAADGLLPAEGAVIVVLKRLDDAIRGGDRIHGIIRGIGLSNDGRPRGFLAPDMLGQVRAMRAAYEGSGLSPQDISYVECHATGTPVGDGIEIDSMAEVFGENPAIAIGSLKSNLGHLITVSGAAGLLKVLAMMESESLPPTLNVETPTGALEGRPFQLQLMASRWDCIGPRRAAINNFGFGGNNAHLIVEAFDGVGHAPVHVAPPRSGAEVALCGIGVVVGNCRGVGEFGAALDDADGKPRRTVIDEIQLPLKDLHFPPNDLSLSLPQQLLIIEAAFEAVAGTGALPTDRTGVLIGMGCDAEISRFGLRWRLRDLLKASGFDLGPAWIETARADLMPPLTAAGVLGSMPNIPANRLNVQFDWRALGFTVSSEELSGLVALQLAIRALTVGELDAALVGAVDLSVEPVHLAAAESLFPPDRRRPGDAAVAMVLKRLVDAERDGDTILAVFEESDGSVGDAATLRLDPDAGESTVTRRFGHAHAASGLLHVAAAVLTSSDDAPSHRRISVTSFSGRRMTTDVHMRPGARHDHKTDPKESDRIIRLPAHLPPVRLPKLPPSAEEPTRAQAISQAMATAPSLPPVAEHVPVTFAEPVVRASATEPGGHGQSGSPRLEHADVTDGGIPLARVLSRTATLHREHIERQTRMYQDFLALQDTMWRRFAMLRAGHRKLSDAPLPSVAPLKPKATSAMPRIGDDDAFCAPARSHGPEAANTVIETPSGPSLTRDDLERLATGRIADIFGAPFEKQAGYLRQVRMPEPPLLLADRVTGIAGEPGSMERGTMWTETDVPPDAWYLHHGHMPPGIVIESGQADLLLISWLGADFLNKGERVYRLLGCELTFHGGGLPKPGDTLRYDIHVDGHAKTGDVRLFFFHYDCRIGERTMLTVREGQAGFFTDAELDASGGVLWRAEDDAPKPDARMDPPPCLTEKRSFSADDVAVFVAGNAYACFGPGFELAAAHQRTPSGPAGRMRLIDSISEFDPAGGPWGRGYLRAEAHVPVDVWFYEGHFKNDPCMPGTLMADAAVQALAFSMAAMGFTVARDGWRFEPVTGEAFKFICRGQVVPDRPHHLSYEVFIEEVIDGDVPTVYAALLCSSDGFKVFQCRRFGLKLVPDWPLSTRGHLIPAGETVAPVGSEGDVRGDFSALLACAWGTPSEAFGSMYRRFDGTRRVPRLPGPPYHFMSRVIEVDCPPGNPTEGGGLIAEFDVPPEAWYFRDNGRPVMPFSVLLEVLLQPCGWLASYMGFALGDNDLAFRNLDGDQAVVHNLVGPDTGTLRTRATLTRYSRVGEMTIVFFRVDCGCADGSVFSMNTSFGFFSADAFANQTGLPTGDADRARLDALSDVHIDLRSEPSRLFKDQPRLAGKRLRMIDEITGYRPKGGERGLGYIRGRQEIDADAWYFKAHFYQDPVQAGSLGLEALAQLLQVFMRLSGIGKEIPNPRFQPIALGEALIWKYRGQVLPTNHEVVTELEIMDARGGDGEAFVTATGSLWVDGLRIYEVENLTMRIVPALEDEIYVDWEISFETDPWIRDHRPTHTLAALPMMAEIDFAIRSAQSARPAMRITGVEDFEIYRWLVIDEDRGSNLRVRLTGAETDHADVRLTTGVNPETLVAGGRIRYGERYDQRPAAWHHRGSLVMEDQYETGALFHGPSLQVMRNLRRDGEGASFKIDNAKARAVGLAAVMDGALHGIPHDAPELWFGERAAGSVAYPRCLRSLCFFGPLPESDGLRVEARPAEIDSAGKSCRIDIQIIDGGEVWCEMALDEVFLPKGPIGKAASGDRMAFLRDRQYVPSLRLSDARNGVTVLSEASVRDSNWLAGTLEAAYGTGGTIAEMTQTIAIKEHVSATAKVHPSSVAVKGETAECRVLPGTRFPLVVRSENGVATVGDAGSPVFDPSPMRDDWRRRLGVREWPVEEIYFALVRRFVRSVRLEDADALHAIRDRPALYLANHQVGIESLTFAVAGAVLAGRPLITIAKDEHRQTWLGRLIAHCRTYPGVRLPRALMFFNREDQASFLTMVSDVKSALGEEGLSLMVHAEGTRSLKCREPVTQISGVILDLALDGGLPIIPVRFTGGLPVMPVTERLEYPAGFAAQDIHIGRPLDPRALAELPLGARRERVCDALNALGPDWMVEEPNPGDPQFAGEVNALVQGLGMAPARAAVFHAIATDPDVGDALRRLVESVRRGETPAADDEEQAWLIGLADWFLGRDG